MKNILYIGNKLSKHGFTPTSIETLGVLLKEEGYNVSYSSDKRNQLLRLVDMCLSVIKNRKKTDCVIIDTYSTFSFVYAFMTSQLCRVFNLKYIPILRGGNLPERLDKNPKLCKMIFNHSYKNVAPSGYLMDAFKKRGYGNLVFIPNSVEAKKYTFKKRKIETPKLLWVRSFVSLYNPKMAVDVLKELQKKYPDASLCMVGPDKDGSLASTKQYAESLQLNVIFTGKLSKENWIKLSENYNVFINTTHFDNTPVSVIEAMALGLPVVSTNVGGIPYLVKHNETALLIEDNDLENMVVQVERLCAENDLTDRITSNAKQLVDDFDWYIVKKQWFYLLQQ